MLIPYYDVPFAYMAFAAVLSSCLPAVFMISSEIRDNTPIDWFYEDADGCGVPETIARFSNRRCKIILCFLSLFGFGVSVAICLLETSGEGRQGQRTAASLLVGCWAIILVHASSIAYARSSIKSYNSGLWLLASSMILSLYSIWKSIDHVMELDTYKAPLIVAWIINSVTILALAFISACLPRRPDLVFQGHTVDRERTVSALYKYTWSWIEPLLHRASVEGDLGETDIPYASKKLRAETLKQKWEGLEADAPLLWCLFWTNKSRLGCLCLLTSSRCLVNVLPYWAMLRVLNILEINQSAVTQTRELLGLVVGMALSSLIDSWMEGWLYWYSVSRLAVPVRAQLSCLIFAKFLRRKGVQTGNNRSQRLRLPNGTRGSQPEDASGATASESQADSSRQAIVNLVAVDTERISYFLQFQFLILNGTIKLVIFSLLLVQVVGWIPFAAGISAWLLVVPVSTWTSNLLLAQSKTLMQLRDAKLAKLNEVLLGIQQIKLSASELQWEKKILALRKFELQTLWKYFIADSTLFGCWILGHILLAATSLAIYVHINGHLSPAVAFVSMGLFNNLESTLGSLPELITLGIDTMVSISRVDRFLRESEMHNNLVSGSTIRFRNATISWPDNIESSDEDKFVLHNLNICFPNGELSVISGKTGSGKSLLISAIIGEADILEGSVCFPDAAGLSSLDTVRLQDWIIPRSLSYVSQTPWLNNGTLRNNILFGLPFETDCYNQVIEVCALKQDLAILPDGDCTELGINGATLSGGQKWRITLARAIYSRAEVLVLEDIFSAVDTQVGRWILEKCINGPLCKARTRILATHNLGLVLSVASYVVELDGGLVTYAGDSRNMTHPNAPRGNTSAPDDGQDGSSAPIIRIAHAQITRSPSLPRLSRKYIIDERRERGTVKGPVYAAYLKHSGGILLWTICAVIFLTYQVTIIVRAWWVRVWTTQSNMSGSINILASVNENQEKFMRSTIDSPDIDYFYLKIYIFASVVMTMVGITRYFWIYFLSIKASNTLFSDMLYAVLHVTLQWKDAVPTGRIINRFTADLNIVDQRVPLSWIMPLSSLLRLVGICVASFFTCIYLIPPAALLLILSMLVGSRYLKASRPLRRLESTARSPVFDLFDTTLAGISTIRSFKKCDIFQEVMHKHIDKWTMATFYTSLANRWMSFRLALLSTAFCITVGLIIVFTTIDAALAGFILSFVLDLSDSLRWTVRCYGDMELDMNSMERVDEYINLKTENLSGATPPASWPAAGNIKFRNLDIAYGPDMPLILKNISFSVRHKERVAVVGRTGAGKSSLALALFRCLETRAGSIAVDGIDISTVPLHDLRSRLAIIPQDPILFSGTIRSNLDPLDKHSDSEILLALMKVHLVQNAPVILRSNQRRLHSTNAGIDFSNLSSAITEAGSNLSQGQRQLLFIARTILSRPKIIVFDEATSAVDVATDTLVQRSIREEFPHSTLIVIAHRLSTIADFDKVVFLDKGCVEEFGTPLELWEKGGMFRAICESKNEGEKEKLRNTIFTIHGNH